MRDYTKRFSVEINGRIVAAFSTFGEALEGVEFYEQMPGILTIWDHEDNELMFTQMNL